MAGALSELLTKMTESNIYTLISSQAFSPEATVACSLTSHGEEIEWVNASQEQLHAGNFQMCPVPRKRKGSALMYEVPAARSGTGLQGVESEKQTQTRGGGEPEDMILTRGKVHLSTQC